MELILSLKGFTVSMTPYNMTIAYDSYAIIPKRTFIFCKTIGSFDKCFCQSSRVSFYPGCSVEWKVFEIMQFKTKWSIKETTGRLDWMSHRKWRETKQQPSRARSGNQISCCLLSLNFLCDNPVQSPCTSCYSDVFRRDASSLL